jgi:putative hydrolase of the HAD superfamily
MSYSGLILDFGGVVTTDFYGALSAFSVREGLDARAFVRVLRETTEGREALASVERGQMSQREYEQVIGLLLGLDDHGLLARALADLSPRPEVIDLVWRARARGVRVAALSNSWGTGEYDPYDGYELDELFDAVVISDRVGLRKPSPAIYELTASKIGLPPDDCLFVDDTEANLPAARDLGMGTLFFTGTDGDIAEIERRIGIAYSR